MALVLKSKNSYRKGKEMIVHVGLVSSNLEKPEEAKKEIEEYEKSCGDKLRKEGDVPLYFSQRPIKDGDKLSKTFNGRFQVFQENLDAMTPALENEILRQTGKLHATVEFFQMSKTDLLQAMFG